MRPVLSLLQLLMACLCWHAQHIGGASSSNPRCVLPPCPTTNSRINFSYPFGIEEGCGASSAFLVQPWCNQSSPPRWVGFNKILGQNDLNQTLSPYVIDISPRSDADSPRYMKLTWNLSALNSQGNSNASAACTPIPKNNLSYYLPNFTDSGIHLDLFKSANFSFTENNLFLLINCSNNTSASNSTCLNLPQQCRNHTDAQKCIQLPIGRDLSLYQEMERNNCSHFQMLFMNTTVNKYGKNEPSVEVGVIQLAWNDNLLQDYNSCQECNKSGGTCGYNTDDAFQCLCLNGNTTSHCATGKCNTGCIIGISSSALFFVIIAIVIFMYCRRKRSQKNGSFSRGIPLISSSMGNSRHKFRTHRALTLSSRLGPVSITEFDYKELVKATDSFAEKNMIGDGGFGAVYLGVLRDGRKVAIKRLYHDNFRKMDQFYNEMKVLSSFQHPHLVKLYGFCCQDEKDLLLVFEYASKGTVWDQLHDKDRMASGTLPWELRLTIACETAEALSYLHNNLISPIYHRDVKTTNILLDENFRVKVADFGLSRLVPIDVSHVTTVPQGSPGYVDPDYHQSYQLTDKSDVYSFGVVLVELVSGQLAVDMSRSRGEINLSSLALTKISCGVWREIVDASLDIDKEVDVERSVKAVLELAFTCLQEEKDDRPAMKQVAEILVNIRRQFGYEDASSEERTGEASKSIIDKDSLKSLTWTDSSNTSSILHSF